MALAFRILQRTLGKAAFLLVAFQVSIWYSCSWLCFCCFLYGLIVLSVLFCFPSCFINFHDACRVHHLVWVINTGLLS